MAMKRTIARVLQMTARRMIATANRLDGPTVRVWDREWNQVVAPSGCCPTCGSFAVTAPLDDCHDEFHGQWAHESWIDPLTCETPHG